VPGGSLWLTFIAEFNSFDASNKSLLRYFSHLSWCSGGLHSSRLLRSLSRQLFTDVWRQPTGPVFKFQATYRPTLHNNQEKRRTNSLLF